MRSRSDSGFGGRGSRWIPVSWWAIVHISRMFAPDCWLHRARGWDIVKAENLHDSI